MAGGNDAKVCFFSEFGNIRESADERIRGFLDEASLRYPDMKILGKWDITSDKAQNKRAVRQMLKKAPETNVVYVINPMDYSICRSIAAEDEEKRIKIITNDLVPIQYEMFKEGIISATICQEPEKQGELPLGILFNYLAYGILPEKVNYTELSIHIEQNI
jgi:ABC-type sugar transport system substrate-binding protein